MLEIAPYIKDVLCLHNAVVIPNLGAFEWLYKPARLEAIDKRIVPPFYQLSFNTNNQQDKRQLLANFIAEQNGMELAAAKEALVSYRLYLEEALLMNKQVLLPEIGRLLLDENGQTSFLVEEDLDWAITVTSGLPILAAEPILRDKSYLKNPQAAVVGRRRFPIVWIAAATLVGVFLLSSPWWIRLAAPGLFKSAPNPNSELSIIPILTEPQERLLELISAYEHSPWASQSEEIAALDTTSTSSSIEDTAETPKTTSSITLSKEQNTDRPKPEPGQPSAEQPMSPNDYIIVVGVFGDRGNVERNEARLREAGYQTQVKKLYTGYTRVAAVVNCSSKQELNEKWASLRNKFTEKAWVAKS